MTQELLKKYFHYEPLNGRFVRIISPKHSKAKVGEEPKYFVDKDGYNKFKVLGTVYFAHRLAWLYVTGSFPEHKIDHKDHNRQNNCFLNLRDVTDLENQRNRSLNRNNKTGQCGVCRSNAKKESWRAYIKVNGKTIALGVYADIKKAIKARQKAEIKYDFHKNHGGVSSE